MGIEDYSDDDLRRMLAKTAGVQGARERHEAIRAALDARGVDDASTDRLRAFQQAISPDD